MYVFSSMLKIKQQRVQGRKYISLPPDSPRSLWFSAFTELNLFVWHSITRLGPFYLILTPPLGACPCFQFKSPITHFILPDLQTCTKFSKPHIQMMQVCIYTEASASQIGVCSHTFIFKFFHFFSPSHKWSLVNVILHTCCYSPSDHVACIINDNFEYIHICMNVHARLDPAWVANILLAS